MLMSLLLLLLYLLLLLLCSQTLQVPRDLRHADVAAAAVCAPS
jgi:hypothetical protein